MSQDTNLNIPPAAPPETPSGKNLPDHVYLVSYPKIVFLYPTVLTSLFCAIVMWAKGDIPASETAAFQAKQAPIVMQAAISAQESDIPAADASSSAGSSPAVSGDVAAVSVIQIHSYHNTCARIFLIVFALNMVVISFDFPRTTSLTWFFAIATLVFGGWFVLDRNPGLAPKILQSLLGIKPWANASFYTIYTLIMLFLYAWVIISRRFDYWEVKGNELLHHHGFLSNLERFAAPNLRISKEINDLFEYVLLRSGRLIIHATNERRAIVLENVLMINSKEERITQMLGALQVRVRTEKE